MKRDPFGLSRVYVAGARTASTIRALLGDDRTLDRVAIDAFMRGELLPDRTMFAAVRQLPASGDPPRLPGTFAERLRSAVASAVASAPRPTVVALSGGLDSAVVLALARELDPSIGALVLDPQIAEYGETTAARATAEQLGCDAGLAPVTEHAFVAAVPAAIAAFETPLYNLHPVSKWLLAAAARERGFASVISGDGADQVFRHDASADYLPLVGAAFDAQAVALHAPFLDIGWVARDPDKRELRELAATLPIRDALSRGPKISRLAPPLAFDAPVDRLVAQLGGPLPKFSDDRVRTRWGTLALLVDAFGAWT